MNAQSEEQALAVQSRNLDAEIEQHKKSIKLSEALLELEKMPQFKAVITEGFFKDFSHNLVMQRGMPEMRDVPALMEANLRKIDSIGELNHYFRGVKAMGAQAKAGLKAAQELEIELNQED